jgi:CRP-like cAMP-binding protein
MSFIVDKVVLEPGKVLFKEKDAGDCAYILESGSIELTRSINGAEVVIATVPKGEILGEMALIDDQPRSATARAMSQCTLLIVQREAFDLRLANADPIVRKLLHRFVTIIRNVTDENVRLTLGIR